MQSACKVSNTISFGSKLFQNPRGKCKWGRSKRHECTECMQTRLVSMQIAFWSWWHICAFHSSSVIWSGLNSRSQSYARGHRHLGIAGGSSHARQAESSQKGITIDLAVPLGTIFLLLFLSGRWVAAAHWENDVWQVRTQGCRRERATGSKSNGVKFAGR